MSTAPLRRADPASAAPASQPPGAGTPTAFVHHVRKRNGARVYHRGRALTITLEPDGRPLGVSGGDAALERLVERLVEQVVDWSGFHDDGRPVPFSRNNVRTLLSRSTTLRRQVRQALLDAALPRGPR